MNGQEFTKKNEDCTLVAQKDTQGYAIGYGHNTPDVKAGDTCTQAQAEAWFQYDYTHAIQTASSLAGEVWDSIDDVRRAALIDMAYELGHPRLSNFIMMFAAVKSEAWATAASECLRSAYAIQVPKRAKKVASMLATGEWPTA